MNCTCLTLPKQEPLKRAAAMTDEKKEAPKDDTPAHSTKEERERLKDFNKGGIPPGAC